MDKITEILHKNEITEQSLYFSRAVQAMEEYGKLKWNEAQSDAGRHNAKNIDKQRKEGKRGLDISVPFFTSTPFKK